MFGKRDHNLRKIRFFQRSVCLQKQFAVIDLALHVDKDAPLILSIELCDLRLK